MNKNKNKKSLLPDLLQWMPLFCFQEQAYSYWKFSQIS